MTAMQIRLAEIAGLPTRLLEAGDDRKGGLPLLLLHPVGFSADVWWRNIEGLGETRAVCAPDLLGHGFSALRDGEGEIGYGPILDHLDALVADLGWQDYLIAGSSLGAQLGLLLALRHGERVRRIVVIGSGTAVQTEADTIATLTKTLANAGKALDDPTPETCRRRLANLCFNLAPGDADALVLSQLTAYARAGAADAYRDLLAATMTPDAARPYRVRERFGEVDVPVLLLWGREDPRTTVEKAEEAQELFANARLVVFEECGHLPYLEHPAAFNRVVDEFFAGI